MLKGAVNSRCFLILVMVASSTSPVPAVALESADERAQLSQLLRYLDALERVADYGDAITDERSARFHFDYTRLREDLHRIRVGVHQYLVPQRAQPNDPAPLHGEYNTVAPAS